MSDAAPSSPLQPRILGRSGRAISPIIWYADEWLLRDNAREIVAQLANLQLNAFFIDAAVSISSIRTALHGKFFPGEGGTLLVGVDLQMLLGRPDTELRERIAGLPNGRCDAVVLQNVSANELKSGRPFHRLSQLRDEGRSVFLIVEATDASQAEWMVENTAAHAIVLPYDIEDQTGRYRVLSAAADLGVGLIARETNAQQSPASRKFRLSAPELSAALATVPKDLETLKSHLCDYALPTDANEREELWNAFKRRVPEPARPRGNHPPEFGS